jgi:hypothetical protein
MSELQYKSSLHATDLAQESTSISNQAVEMSTAPIQLISEPRPDQQSRTDICWYVGSGPTIKMTPERYLSITNGLQEVARVLTPNHRSSKSVHVDAREGNKIRLATLDLSKYGDGPRGRKPAIVLCVPHLHTIEMSLNIMNMFSH